MHNKAYISSVLRMIAHFKALLMIIAVKIISQQKIHITTN